MDLTKLGFDSEAKLDLPPEVRYLGAARLPSSLLYRSALSADGRVFVVGGQDGRVMVHDVEDGFTRSIDILEDASALTVIAAAVAPDGRQLVVGTGTERGKRGGLFLVDVKSGKTLHHKALDHAVQSIDWSPDGKSIAYTGHSLALVTARVEEGLICHEAGNEHGARGQQVRWSSQGGMVSYSSDRSEIGLLQVPSPGAVGGKRTHSNIQADSRIWDTAWSSDDSLLAAGCSDGTIRVFAIPDGKEELVLEGHSAPVKAVGVCHQGSVLVSLAFDRGEAIECRWWEFATGRLLREVRSNGKDHSGSSHFCGLATASNGGVVAVRDPSATGFHFLEAPGLGEEGAEDLSSSQFYKNAKVVLVGDTGVGKSGLGLVLTGRPWEPTESTHGRRVWVMDTEGDLGSTKRELLLWDLAGQPSYRLVHQLHMGDVTLALIVFDSRSETDPFSGVRHWMKALRQAKRVRGGEGSEVPMILVAARTDRGGVAVGASRIESMLREPGLRTFVETSAKTGHGVERLIAEVRAAVDWGVLPRVSSSELFEQIKAFLITEKVAGRVLETGSSLFRGYCSEHDLAVETPGLRAKFDICIGLLENRDLLRRLSFGSYVLLQPELLDSYASAMVNAARNEPDGLGCLAEEDALAGRFELPAEDRLEDREQESLLLIATVRELLRHEIMLKETTEDVVYLVFPTQLTREGPDAAELSGRTLVLDFEGAIQNVYATLAVRLAHSQFFAEPEMWRNTARYRSRVGGACGIALREVEEGRGELTVFFDDAAKPDTRSQFEDYVRAHVERRALSGSVTSRMVIRCPACEEPIPESMAAKIRGLGRETMNCPVCATEISLVPAAAAEPETEQREAAVLAMDRSADEQREIHEAAMVVRGKREAGDFDVFLCHNGQDKAAVKRMGEVLQRHGLLPWLDEWELQPGKRWQPELERRIGSIRSAAVFIGPSGIGPWQDQEIDAFLREFVKRELPVIPVLLEDSGEAPELPLFLGGLTWVDFRSAEPDPLERLLWGITGSRPEF